MRSEPYPIEPRARFAYRRTMADGPNMAGIAALIGDPARANMLSALMAGMALTAGELSAEAGVTKQTASAHLARLLDGGLLAVERQGRHRYYRIANPEVAQLIESLMGVAALQAPPRTRPGPRDAAMRRARVCYDHLAGELAVVLYDACVANGWIALDADGLAPTEAGRAFLRAFGVDLDRLEAGRRPLCRACLDWSVRRPHLAGAVGAALLARIVALGWAARVGHSRVIAFTPAGEAAFLDLLGATDHRPPPAPPMPADGDARVLFSP